METVRTVVENLIRLIKAEIDPDAVLVAAEGRGSLNLTEIVPLGGLLRVNPPNLRQSSGRCRIENCPVYDGLVEPGPLIKDRRFEFRDGVEEDRLHTP